MDEKKCLLGWYYFLICRLPQCYQLKGNLPLKKNNFHGIIFMYKTNVLLYNVIIKLTVQTISTNGNSRTCLRQTVPVCCKKGDSFLLHSAIYHTDHHSRAGYYFLKMKICHQTREESCSYRVILCFIATPLIKICNR